MQFEFDIDLTNIKEIKPIPASVVVLNIDTVKTATSKAGNTVLRYGATILEPEEIAEECDKFFFNVTLTEGALWLVKQLMEAAGCEIEPGKFNAQAPIGHQVGAKVALTHSEEYGYGNQVQGFYPVEKTLIEVSGEWPEEE